MKKLERRNSSEGVVIQRGAAQLPMHVVAERLRVRREEWRGLAARGAAYRRGEAPTPTTPELSAGARRVAEQFRDELEKRRAADDDARTARARARGPRGVATSKNP
mgnify:CR=1 FL=1